MNNMFSVSKWGLNVDGTTIPEKFKSSGSTTSARMALFLKQDFTPPVLSRKWIAMKFHPNMLLYNREHIISILESGLLFREDSVEVEQEFSPLDFSVWMSRGERVLTLLGVGLCAYLIPPRSFNRSLLYHCIAYASIPLTIRTFHRISCYGSLSLLLGTMRDYLALARRAAACVKESAALRAQLESVSSVIESTHRMLCRQQTELCVLMARASSAILGNAPWIRSDVSWEAFNIDSENLLKIHHAFMVVQSAFLKHIALAHTMPSVHAQKLYKNHNERIYWIHTVLIKRIYEELKDNYDALERMYRLLKNYGNQDVKMPKKFNSAIKDNWFYSEVHTGIAAASLELKIAADKCSNLDMFLDSCAVNKQEIDPSKLDQDIDTLIDNITKCLTTVQSSQLRLNKLKKKIRGHDNGDESDKTLTDVDSYKEDVNILKIEDKEPETKDEVFYFVKTEDDEIDMSAGDLVTVPGRKEKETTKIVLNELKRKLVVRENVMRERERQALKNTMPELKNNVPEFPRQISNDYVDRQSIITRLLSKYNSHIEHKLNNNFKVRLQKNKLLKRNYRLKILKYESEKKIELPFYEANSNLNIKSKYITYKLKPDRKITILRWCKTSQPSNVIDFDSNISEGLSDIEASAVNRNVKEAVNDDVKQAVNGNRSSNLEAKNLKFSKRDLELSQSSSESDSDMFYNDLKHFELLKDARRVRASRKKNYPTNKRAIDKTDNVDEGSKPTEYNLGAGIAMASVLQISSQKKIPNFVQEEIFIGDGEVSNDSGNDEDA